jgi:formylglycine-generating enzyme
MRAMVAWLLLALPAASLAAASGYAQLPGGVFRTSLKYEDVRGPTRIAPFALQKRPVTNAEFLAFVQRHRQWRRDRVAAVFAQPGYLAHWSGDTALGASALPEQPVTHVSWFAARAYCQAQGARLPTWSEWEYAAAADETRRDARADPRWRERILNWYARPSNRALPRAGLQAPNVYGVQDLHGLVWEWVEDHGALLVLGDARAMDDRDNYAVLMRVAMLSSLDASDSTGNLGFRCARSVP